MSRIPSSFNAPASERSITNTDAINDLELGTFLKLMITELQNQDPLNPLDNKDMLAQISQIREVGATDKLTKTLESVLLGQNIASATNLIGADVEALSDDAERITGLVKHVSIDQGVPKLHIDLDTEAAVSEVEGNLKEGKYAYQIVWEEAGKLRGIELSGDDAVLVTEDNQAVALRNLPKNGIPKQIFRTDATGKGPYQLVGTLTGGNEASFVDRLSDDERSLRRLTESVKPSIKTSRSYEVSLRNVGVIRPPKPTLPPVEDGNTDDVTRPLFTPPDRGVFAP